MSETVARQRPPVDLDDFERRFRQTQRLSHEDDPLAELARIVGEDHDPYGEVFAQPAAPVHQEFRPGFAPHARQEPSFGDAGKPRSMPDFAAIEAGLRGATAQPFDHQQEQDHLLHQQMAPGHDVQQDYAGPDYAFPPEAQAQAAWADPARVPPRKRSALKPATAIAGSIAIAIVGIGVAFAYKGTGSSPREIRTIMAAAGPTKIQPPADANADASNQEATGQSQAAPTKLVSREEQPVDLQQAVQDNAARNAAAHGTDASSVPVPGQPEGTMSPDYSALGGAQGATKDAPAPGGPSYGDQGFGVGMPQPKRVKSVMVKPDGTIVSNGQDAAAPSAAPPAPAKSDDRIGALVDGATPADASPKSHAKAAKTTTRVATASPTPAPDSIDEAAAAAPAPKPAKTATKKTKPVKVATAETGTEQAANDAGEEAKPAGNGGFAVQLAAPGSEADARSATSKFLKKYSGALHGQRLGFHRADSNGKTVYRVRVSSLTKADAASLCSKLKAEGGSCFVAKD